MVKPTPAKLGKRKAAAAPAAASKKPKAKAERELGPTGKPKRRPDQPKKVKLRDQKTIPVPRTVFAGPAGGNGGGDSDIDDDDDVGMEDEVELEAFRKSGFLASADIGALSRSVKETRRLHQLAKEKAPKLTPRAVESDADSDVLDYDFDSDLELSDEPDRNGSGSDDGSDSEDENEGEDDDDDEDDDEELGSSDFASSDGELDDSDFDDDALSFTSGSSTAARAKKRRRPEGEADYELAGRARWARRGASAEAEADHVEVGRLPIKLPTGEVRAVEGTTRVAVPQSKQEIAAKRAAAVAAERGDASDEDEEEEELELEEEVERMAGQKGRFGRLGVVEIVAMGKGRLEAAKEQIAAIGAEILAGGELVDIAPTLTRLSTFALPTVPEPETSAALVVPNSVRALALLSMLAVYKDLVPGYRIRALTELEEAEKVRDEVRRLREGEKALVRSYRGYLKTLEAEVKGKTALASLALRCLADLLSSHPHFNFSENIMAVLVSRVGRRSWDGAGADVCLSAFVALFRADLTGEHSRTLVRLLARMIKERKYQVHANVLGCLLHLRLRTELGSVRDHERDRARNRAKYGKGKGKDREVKVKDKSEVRRVWRTKNERKREKEMKEIRKEMDEAEAEVDQEEREATQTETLKDLFVLYFSILKHPGRSPLLPAALEGISHFAHLINVDFFRDLLLVLRRLITDADAAAGPVYVPNQTPSSVPLDAESIQDEQRTRLRLLAIVTAFDLLSGQGEALNIDLADFINALYGLIPSLCIDTGIEDPPAVSSAAAAAPAALHHGRGGQRPPAHTQSTADLVFRCLDAIFFPRFVSQANASPAVRTAAFAKRLTEAALVLPAASARRALEFVRRLVVREPKVEALLDTEERAGEGTYRPESADPQIANPWATSLWEVELLRSHFDGKVRAEAKRLAEGRYA
ncbi:hypothetical protein Q5752_006985 [Cryptotrichosporon argae]